MTSIIRKKAPSKNKAGASTTPAPIKQDMKAAKKAVPSAIQLNKSTLDILGIDSLCDRIQSGETLSGITRSLKLSHVSVLLRWIAADSHRSARVREARTSAAAMYDELAQEYIENAADPFELTKAREMASHLRWRASKVAPSQYGDRVQVDATVDHKVMQDDALLSRLAKFGIALPGIIPNPESDDAG